MRVLEATEVEKVYDRKGRSVASGTPAEIKSRLRATHVVVVKSLDGNLGLEAYGNIMKAGSTVSVRSDRTLGQVRQMASSLAETR